MALSRITDVVGLGRFDTSQGGINDQESKVYRD